MTEKQKEYGDLIENIVTDLQGRPSFGEKLAGLITLLVQLPAGQVAIEHAKNGEPEFVITGMALGIMIGCVMGERSTRSAALPQRRTASEPVSQPLKKEER